MKVHVADGTVADLLDAVQVVPLMAALQADHDREFLLLRLRVGRHAAADTRARRRSRASP